MNEVLCCKALRERLKVTLKDIHHPTDPSRGREQVFKSPNIVNGYLPPKRSGQSEQDFPFVIVRPSLGETEMQSGHAQEIMTVKVLIGSYGEDDDDYEYAMNILGRIKTDLRQRPFIAAREFKCRPDMKWMMPDEQATTVFFVELLLRFELPTPQDLLEDDGYAV